jgi:hypothetical protein
MFPGVCLRHFIAKIRDFQNGQDCSVLADTAKMNPSGQPSPDRFAVRLAGSNPGAQQQGPLPPAHVLAGGPAQPLERQDRIRPAYFSSSDGLVRSHMADRRTVPPAFCAVERNRGRRRSSGSGEVASWAAGALVVPSERSVCGQMRKFTQSAATHKYAVRPPVRRGPELGLRYSQPHEELEITARLPDMVGLCTANSTAACKQSECSEAPRAPTACNGRISFS